MTRWESGAANEFGSNIFQRSTMHWVLNPPSPDDVDNRVAIDRLARAASAAEAFGTAGQAMTVDTFFYFPDAGAAFSTQLDIPSGFVQNRTVQLRALFDQLPVNGPQVVWAILRCIARSAVAQRGGGVPGCQRQTAVHDRL
ncbi:hypothetical protein [Pseudomonas syringae]|uniref:hypothetical protein n=1 Tax=Pseudomonas syringae TaxID=317 RepID=UPI001E2F3B40|nr:hypothetical protein [Pseudomonas syringae]